MIKAIKEYRKKNPKKTNAKRFTRSKVGNFFYFAVLIAGGLFSVLPLIYSISTSFKPLDELLLFPPTFFVRRATVTNYAALPGLLSSMDVPFLRYIINSLGVAIVTTFIYVIISAMASFALSKGNFKGRKMLFAMVEFALMFGAYTLAVPQYLISAKLHIIDTYWAYILPMMVSTLGVFLIKQYIEGYLPDALLEAARIDGAGYFRIFWSIVMPIIKPAWLTLTLFSFRDAWAFVPNGTIFNESLKTLPQIVSQVTAGGTARAGSSAALTVIMMIPPIVVYLISQSNVVEAMSSAGIKE